MLSYWEIVELVGYDSAMKGRIYPFYKINKTGLEELDDHFEHTYNVESESSAKIYNVKISNNGLNIMNFECTCPQFKKNNTCKHVGAILVKYCREMVEYEKVDFFEATKSILKNYHRTKNNIVKEKVDLQVEFIMEYSSVYIRLHIGQKKKYIISTKSKLDDFVEAFYNNKKYEFGKMFTYDSKIHYFDKISEEVISFLNECYGIMEGRYFSGMSNLSLSNREFMSLLEIIKDSPFMIDGNNINSVYYGLPTNFLLTKENNIYNLSLENMDKYKFKINNKYVVYNNDLYILNFEEIRYLNLLHTNKIKSLVFEETELKTFSNGLFDKIKNNLTIDDNITEISIPVKPDIKLYFDIQYSKLTCNIIFKYKDKEINYFSKEKITRDNDTELEVVKEIINIGFIEDNKSFIMTNSDDMYTFLDEGIKELSDKYEVFTSKKIDSMNFIKKTSIENNFSIGKSGIMSYSFKVDNIDNEELNNLFEALKQKKKYYKLKNNNVISLEDNDELNDLNKMMEDLNISEDDISNGTAEIPKYRALYIDSLKKKNNNIKTNNLFDEFINNFNKYKDSNIEIDKNDLEILRDYQIDGVKWLNTIYKCDLGGILADEMGLGKSLQTIVFIKDILKEKPNSKIIIVVPTSLIYNWEKEFIKFAPDLKYVLVADNKSKRLEVFSKINEYNIFITSYGLIRNDKDEYENIDFELCVVDEAQNIKNNQAEMTKEIKKIKAKCKIALTGTPLENNVSELWSIFDYIMPGYLNTITKFKEKYNISDVDEESLKTLNSLNYQIKPFILRRKKSDVIKSLPPKIENKVYIDLPDKQKLLYLKVLNDTKKEMDDMIDSGGFQKYKMKILQLLTKLRQICIDPTVMYENYNGERIKIDELLRIVKENIENGHKILIFSCFKRVLDNVHEVLNQENISSYMIDGSIKSKDRMNMVESFNKDDTNCFLITLKAGGTGLNLTGADVVIHLDIWWNPQVENQATDRAHRIGQTKSVSVIKLITKGTIEERIIELQEKKKILNENLIEGKDSTEALTSLSEKEIRKLLSISE